MPSRYRVNKVEITETGKRYKINSYFPDIPLSEDDIYIITTEGDRFDILAQQFYGDSSLWWVIPAANSNTKRGTLFPETGIQLRIPANKEQVINLYESVNRNR